MRHWSQEDPWSDDDQGPLVRPYTVTGGRTRSARSGIELIALVSTIRAPDRTQRLQPEQHRLLALCRRPTALVEIAARLDLPVTVVRVLLGDLLDHELVSVSSSPAAGIPDARFLQAVIDGIRKL
ncbi:Protein of unknown function [Streptomyces sp. DvalAA-14]|uniref:DUF742 domain-containing protein n=1 Tax=unclassified Streptomyces TaxID=2593676 RepID=UPI00081B91D9|nr:MULTISPECIES: DUF742 domain-containing protein [unclassified Streptomyces]MYS24410.1 DUF742 domain-containing protein [Streptomyces sp. SID4948]SCE45779.1 Protein of unknown function [Streptomyces sp. DvalAA-14]